MRGQAGFVLPEKKGKACRWGDLQAFAGERQESLFHRVHQCGFFALEAPDELFGADFGDPPKLFGEPP